MKDNDTKYQNEVKSKDSTISFLRKKVKDQDDMLKALNENFNTQESELTSLGARLHYLEDQQKNGWPNEKKEVSDQNFAKGFNFYLVGFIANEPDYTFEKFGQEIIEEMIEFKNENAQAIKERRIELGLEE